MARHLISIHDMTADQVSDLFVAAADVKKHPKAYRSALGGQSLAGFTLFFRNPFLLGIGLFLFLYTGIGSFVYLELKNLMDWILAHPSEARSSFPQARQTIASRSLMGPLRREEQAARHRGFSARSNSRIFLMSVAIRAMPA